MEINELVKHIHENAKNKGWWDNVRPIPETLMLIVTEVAEAMEAYRNDDKENLREELADIVIRVMDACGGYDIDLEAEILKKHKHNKTRSYRHGEKVC